MDLHFLIYPKFVTFLIALFGCSIFSFLETTITALRLFKLKELAQATGKYHSLFSYLEKDPSRVLATILVGSSLANAAAAALITDIIENLFVKLEMSNGFGFTVGISVATILILIFGEIIPKNLAKACGEKLFKSTLWFTNITFYMLYPFVTTLIKFSNFVINKFGNKVDGGAAITSEKEIKFLIDYIDEKGLMDQQKTSMLRSIFELGQTPVKEIMVPSADVVSINIKASIQEALGMFSKYRFSRLPAYENKSDNIVGMIHQRDIFVLLQTKENKTLRDIARQILFVPESVKVNQLLKEFRSEQKHMAMVLNEFGSIIGLATLEDVLEEIVGEISDEDEQEIKKIVPLEDGGWVVDAGIDLNEIGQTLGIRFETEDAITLGGFLTEQLQHLPKKGERILYKHFYLQVQKSTSKRVKQVLVFAEKSFRE
ncbi:HlyC/CorC family transporter [bacterium]|jgi:putative hemolysin|nr:HlyC/CorC family transporter [bacterium]